MNPARFWLCLFLLGATGCAPSIEKTHFPATLNVDLSASTKLASGEYVRDLVTGTGAAVTNGAAVSVRYSGWLADGTLFDSNEGKELFSFHYGAGEVIQGWDQGLDGVKAGGSRQLIIPPALGYGETGAPPAIPGNAILVGGVGALTGAGWAAVTAARAPPSSPRSRDGAPRPTAPRGTAPAGSGG